MEAENDLLLRRLPAKPWIGYVAPILARRRGWAHLPTKDFEQCVLTTAGVSGANFGAWLWAGGKEEEEKFTSFCLIPTPTASTKPALPAGVLRIWCCTRSIARQLGRNSRCAAQHLYKLAWKESTKRARGYWNIE